MEDGRDGAALEVPVWVAPVEKPQAGAVAKVPVKVVAGVVCEERVGGAVDV